MIQPVDALPAYISFLFLKSAVISSIPLIDYKFMSVSFISGRLGSGKSLTAVGMILNYLSSGRTVATNLDLFLEHFPSSIRTPCFRLPAKPRLDDFRILGYGCELEDWSGESNGLIVLDEMLSWLNSRSWQDPERRPVLEWLRHARKYRWDVIFIAQSIASCDKQAVNELCEYHWTCRNTKTLPLPIFGTVFRLFGFHPRFPSGTVASLRYGTSSTGEHIERRWYRAKHLYKLYNTGQIFADEITFSNGQIVDNRAVYSYLSPYLIRGRYLDKRPSLFSRISHFLALFLVSPIIFHCAVTGASPYRTMKRLGILT